MIEIIFTRLIFYVNINPLAMGDDCNTVYEPIIKLVPHDPLTTTSNEETFFVIF